MDEPQEAPPGSAANTTVFVRNFPWSTTDAGAPATPNSLSAHPTSHLPAFSLPRPGAAVQHGGKGGEREGSAIQAAPVPATGHRFRCYGHPCGGSIGGGAAEQHARGRPGAHGADGGAAAAHVWAKLHVQKCRCDCLTPVPLAPRLASTKPGFWASDAQLQALQPGGQTRSASAAWRRRLGGGTALTGGFWDKRCCLGGAACCLWTSRRGEQPAVQPGRGMCPGWLAQR